MSAVGPTEYSGYKPKWEGEYDATKGRARGMGSSVFGGSADPNVPGASQQTPQGNPDGPNWGRDSHDSAAMKKRRDREHYEALRAQAEQDRMRKSVDSPLQKQAASYAQAQPAQYSQPQYSQPAYDPRESGRESAPSPLRNGPQIAFATPTPQPIAPGTGAQSQQQPGAVNSAQAVAGAAASAVEATQQQFAMRLQQAQAVAGTPGSGAAYQSPYARPPNSGNTAAVPPSAATAAAVPPLDESQLQDNMSRLHERAAVSERTSQFLVDRTNKLQDEVVLRASAAEERLISLEKTARFLTDELSNSRYDLKRQLAEVQTSQRQELDKLLQLYSKIEQHDVELESNAADIRRKTKQDDSDISRLEVTVTTVKESAEAQYMQARERTNKNADNIRRLQKQAQADQNELTHQIDDTARRVDTLQSDVRKAESDAHRLFDEVESLSKGVKRNYENVDNNYRKHEADIAEVRRTAFDQLTQAATELRSTIEETKTHLALSVENLYKTTTEMIAAEREERVRREQAMQQAFEAELQRRAEKEAQDAIEINNRFAEAANELLREQELRHADQNQLRHDFNLQTADLEKTLNRIHSELQNEDTVLRRHFDGEVATLRGSIAVLEHTVQNNYTSLAEVLRAEIKSRLYSDQESKNKFDHLVLSNQQEHQSMRADVKALEDKTRRNILKSEDRMHAALTELHGTVTDEIQQLSDETVRQVADIEVMINGVKNRVSQLDDARSQLRTELQGKINTFVDDHKQRLKEEDDAREVRRAMNAMVDRVEGDAVQSHLQQQNEQNKSTVESVKRLGLVFKNLNAMVGKIGLEVKENAETVEKMETKIDSVSGVVVDIQKNGDEKDEISRCLNSMIDVIVENDRQHRKSAKNEQRAGHEKTISQAVTRVDDVFGRLEVEVAQIYYAQDKLRDEVRDKVANVADTVDDRLKDFTADQQNHIDSVGDRLESFMKTNTKAVTKNSDEILSLRKDYEKLEIDVEDGVAGISKEIDETTKKMTAIEKNMKSLEDQVDARIDDHKVNLESQVEQMGTVKGKDLEQYQETIDELQEKVRDLDQNVQNKFGQVEREFGVAYMERSELKEDVEARLKEVESSVDSKLERHTDKVSGSSDKATLAITNMGDDLGQVEDRLGDIEDTLKEWQDRTIGVGKDMLNLDERVGELSSKTEGSDRLVNKLNKQVTSNNDILQEVKSDMLGVRSIMQEQVDKVTKANDILRGELDDTSDELRKEMKRIEDTFGVNTGALAELNDKVQNQKPGVVDDGISDRVGKLEKKVNDKFANIEQEFGQVYLDAAAAKDQSAKDTEEVQESIADLKKRVAKSDAVIELLSTKEDTWEDVVASKVTELTQQELKQLKTKLTTRMDEIENSMEAIEEKNSVANVPTKVEKNVKELQKLKAALAELDDALNDQISQNKSKADQDLRSFKNATNTKLDDLSDAVETMRDTNDPSKTRDMKRQVNELRRDVDDLMDGGRRTGRGRKGDRSRQGSDEENDGDNGVKLPKIPTRENTPSKGNRTDRTDRTDRSRATTPGRTHRSSAR